MELQAPEIGGIYNIETSYTDNEKSDSTNFNVRILKEAPIKIITEEAYMYIFDYRDFTVKDIAQLYNYEINIDEETNANSIIKYRFFCF